MFRFLLALSCLAVLPGVAAATIAAGAPLVQDWSTWWPLWAGVATGVIIDQMVLRRIPGLETFEHELTHAIMALLLLRSIRQFTVSRHRGGYVAYSGGLGGELGNDLIGFAPYFLPTFTALSVLLRPLFIGRLPPNGVLVYDAWVGFTLGFHLWSTLRETRVAWTHDSIRVAGSSGRISSDLGKRGLLYSGATVLALALATHGILAGVVVDGYAGAATWGKEVWSTSADLAEEARAIFVSLNTRL